MPSRGSRLIPLLCLSLFCVAIAACAGPPPKTPRTTPPKTHPRFSDERPAGALEIRLIYSAEADLDLFVTDPRKEAVYFGNNPSLGGGELDIDRRCGAETPRVEVIRFPVPMKGEYRVGVSYDRACGFRRRSAPYILEIRADDVEIDRRGELAPGTFDSVALEFELE
jgi:hypothetical protein